MLTIICCFVCSVITSIIVTKILATHYFQIVDGYVNSMVDETKKFVETVLTKIGKS